MLILAGAAGCGAPEKAVPSAAGSSSSSVSAPQPAEEKTSASSAEASSSAVVSASQSSEQEKDIASLKEERTQKLQTEESTSPIPKKDVFIAAHNKAAETLGGSIIDSEKLEPLSWGGKDPIEGGFLYDGYTNGYASGVVMFEPEYIRVTGHMSDPEMSIKEYAAIAAGVTGGDPQKALEAMRGLVENVEEDTWTNGYEVNLGEVVFEDVTFTIEIGRQNGIAQFFANPDGLAVSLEKNA